MQEQTTQTAWRETPILCRCQGQMVSDGKSLPWCPDCSSQMSLYDLLQWLITPLHTLDPEIAAEQGVVEEMGWSLQQSPS